MELHWHSAFRIENNDHVPIFFHLFTTLRGICSGVFEDFYEHRVTWCAWGVILIKGYLLAVSNRAVEHKIQHLAVFYILSIQVRLLLAVHSEVINNRYPSLNYHSI
jgi:hypothetical protein